MRSRVLHRYACCNTNTPPQSEHHRSVDHRHLFLHRFGHRGCSAVGFACCKSLYCFCNCCDGGGDFPSPNFHVYFLRSHLCCTFLVPLRSLYDTLFPLLSSLSLLGPFAHQQLPSQSTAHDVERLLKMLSQTQPDKKQQRVAEPVKIPSSKIYGTDKSCSEHFADEPANMKAIVKNGIDMNPCYLSDGQSTPRGGNNIVPFAHPCQFIEPVYQ